jgi:hypothetical protein
MEQRHPTPQTLTPEVVIQRYQWGLWRKVAPTKIRPFLPEDITIIGPTFRDLEGREHRVEAGRCLCAGPQGDRWTCSVTSLERERVPISDFDAEGFRLYQMRHPQDIRAFDIPHPFHLQVQGHTWECSEPAGGFVTWNGQTGADLIMRVNQRATFLATYAHPQTGEE